MPFVNTCRTPGIVPTYCHRHPDVVKGRLYFSGVSDTMRIEKRTFIKRDKYELLMKKQDEFAHTVYRRPVGVPV